MAMILAVVLPGIAVAQESTLADGIRFVAVDGTDNNTNGLAWTSAFASLGGALSGFTNSCPAQTTPPKTCVIHVGAGLGITLSSNFVLNRSNTTIECEPGAIINMQVPSGNGAQIVINADDTRITGCAFLYISGSDAAIAVEAAPSTSTERVSIDHNLFKSFPTGSSVVFAGDGTNNSQANVFVTDVNVADNVFWQNGGNHITVEDNAQRVNISRNQIFTLADTANQLINAFTEDSGTAIQGLIIDGNTMFNGLAGACIFLKQIGGNGGNPITDVAISSNTCTLQSSSSTAAGYSLSGVTGLSFVGNIFDATQPQEQVNQPAFNFVNVKTGTVSGNSAVLGSQSAPSQIPPLLIIYNVGAASISSATGYSVSNSFTGNTASVAFSPGSVSGAAVICWDESPTGSGSANISNNTFTANGCDFSNSSSTAQTVGFYVQGGNSSTTINSNFISENSFIPSTSGTTNAAVGICLEQDSSSMANNVVGPNNVFSLSLPFCQNLGSLTPGLKSSTVTSLSYGSGLSGPCTTSNPTC
jgi:hypothetical protein